MGDFVQDHKSLGCAVQRHPIPIEPTPGLVRVDRHPEGAGDGERREAMPLGLHSGGAVRRGRADPAEYRAGEPVGEADHEMVQPARERFGRYRRQDHLVGPRATVGARVAVMWAAGE